MKLVEKKRVMMMKCVKLEPENGKNRLNHHCSKVIGRFLEIVTIQGKNKFHFHEYAHSLVLNM
jgi:hypothetical protein